MNMTLYHRINVWRIAYKCPVCGAERGYSDANIAGLEFNCSNMEHCGFSEFVPTSVIHMQGNEIGNARFEVLDRDNNVRQGWRYMPKKSEREQMKQTRKECRKHLRAMNKGA